VSEVRSLLDQLAALDVAAVDVDGLSDQQLLECAPQVYGGINRLGALLTRVVGAVDRRQAQRVDGMVTVKAWLTGHCRMAGTEAAGYVRAGRRLGALPELAAAYADGAVGAGHVQVVAAAVTPARVAAAAEAGIDLATTDRVLTEAACVLGPEDTAKAVRRWVAGIDPDGTLDEAAGLLRVFPDGGERRGPRVLLRTRRRRRRRDRAHRAGGGDERPPPGRRPAQPC
jgi:hypothetical protein